MSATTINFVRHGKVYNPNHVLYERLPGFHLSTSGRRMAETTGRYIAESPQLNTATAVYSSPLDRTRETADAILIELNALRAERGQEQLKLLTDKRLIEAGNDFRGKRIGHGDGALWRPENLKLVRNLWRPTWGESYRFLTAGGKRGISHGDMIDMNRENFDGFDVREFYVQLVHDLKKRGY